MTRRCLTSSPPNCWYCPSGHGVMKQGCLPASSRSKAFLLLLLDCLVEVVLIHAVGLGVVRSLAGGLYSPCILLAFHLYHSC